MILPDAFIKKLLLPPKCYRHETRTSHFRIFPNAFCWLNCISPILHLTRVFLAKPFAFTGA
jgi:hypothetical protein